MTKVKFIPYILSLLGLFITLCLAFFFLGFSTGKNKYFLGFESRKLEAQLIEIVDLAKENPGEALIRLKQFPEAPLYLENRKNYLLSDLYITLGKPDLALETANLISKDYLPQYSGYQRARLAEILGLEAQVVNELDYLIHLYPRNPKFFYELGKSFARQNMNQKAIEVFEELQKRFPKTDYYYGASYYLANLSNDKQLKIKLYKEYLQNKPEGNFAHLIAENLSTLDTASRKEFEALSNFIALSYYWHKDYAKAIKYFDLNLDTPELYAKAYVKSLLSLGLKFEAKSLIYKFLGSVKDPDLAEDLFDLLGRINVLSVEELKILKARFAILAPVIQWNLANKLENPALYEEIFTKYPLSKYAAESLSRFAFDRFLDSDLETARALFEDHLIAYPKSLSRPFVLFWLARIYSLQSKSSKSTDQLNRLIRKFPNNYYAFRAKQVLSFDDSWYQNNQKSYKVKSSKWKWLQIYPDYQIKSRYGKEVLELCRIHQYDFLISLKSEIKYDDEFMVWLYANAGELCSAINEADKKIEELAPSLNHSQFHYAFPLLYSQNLIKDSSIDPLLVHALIKQESHYQPDIVSPAGAIGLMQLMPYTARSLSPSATTKSLMRPDFNIQLGVSYLKLMLQNFDNNLIYTIASYNAGPIISKTWQQGLDSYPPDIQVELIPYGETRNYVKRVFANYWIYRQLYASL